MTTKTPRSPHAKPSVLGLGGFKEHGKDALADALEAQGWVKLGMSDTLARALYVLNPLIPTTITNVDGYVKARVLYTRYQELADEVGYVKAKENPEVRRLLQQLGTEVGRVLISDSVWTDIVARTVRRHVAEGDSVVITGIRYPNELDMIRDDLKGLAYWVDRPGHEQPADSHSSENTLRVWDFDGIIYNDGTLADLDAVGRLIDWRDDHGTLQETEGAAGLLNGLSARDIARLEKYSVINPEAAGNHRGEPRTAESEAEAERLNAKYSEQGL